jgi:class 3 adenylate cyclase/tetratricopeptide (TPR) repeat protein
VQSRLPTGTVTFLFTDIEGSTRLLKRLGKAYGGLLADHREILRRAVREHGGEEVDNQGDSFLFAFARADEAVGAAIDGQRALVAHDWPGGGELRVRMGMHTAEPSASNEGYYGLGVHRAARIMAAAHGGQILLSLASSSVLEDAELDGARVRDLGEYWLKDLDRPERIYQLDVGGLKSIFPPPRQDRPAAAVDSASVAEQRQDLLERADATATLARSLADVVRTAQGRLVLVAGEAGVGKTTLLRRFCDDQRNTVRVLWGACDPLFTPRPLGPLVDVAESSGGELEDVVNAGGKPQSVASALMRELRSREVTALVLEDLHWADEATLDVVALLGRRADAVPALIMLTFRDDELDRRHPLRILLGALATAHSARRIEIAPLSREAVAQLAAPHGVDADELFRKTAGNPFFATEALASGEAELPHTVREAVLARAASLTPPAAALLEAVAIAPPHVELWLLEALADEDVACLDECLASGMLSHGPSGVAFRHELARLAVEESLSPNRRLALHRRALAALADPPSGGLDLERLAHHADAADDGPAVLRYAPAAAERAAALGAHRESASQYGKALRFANALPSLERAELLKRRSHECYLTDQSDEAIAALRRAVDCYRELGDARGEGDSLRRLANILWCPGQTTEAADTARAALTVLEPLPHGPELAMAYATIASLSKDRSEADVAVGRATQALELAEQLNHVETRAHATNTIATTELFAGRPGAREKLEASLELALRSDLPDHVGRAYVHLIQNAAQRRAYDLSDRYLDEGLAYLGERGLDLWCSYLHAFGAKIALDRGRYDQAGELAALVFQKRVISTSPRINAFVVLGLLRARRDEADASLALDEAFALAEPSGELLRIAPVAAARAETAWLAGDRAGIGAATEFAFELALRHPVEWPLGELAMWRWRAGLLHKAPAGSAEQYAAQIAGDWAGAAELWGALGCPYDAASALADSGDQEPLHRALVEFEQLGAVAAARLAASRLG